ncbi:MAG TPA: YsnF/AvaK domain-containing protein [Xanthobacteraceae bacterium]|jgi:uncharacterized protein (TIGR02271 family)
MSKPDHRDADVSQPGEASRSATEATSDDSKLQLLAEELSVAKETQEAGRVRISTRTHEREALIDEDLAHERVEIETIPIGVRVDAVPEVRQEGNTTVIPVVEEFLVVDRQLRLKEEIRVKRVRTTERHQEKVMLRHQEAVVTRHQPDTSKAGVETVTEAAQTKTETE